MKLAVLFHRVGPYHKARLKAAAKKGNIVSIEFSGRDDTYDWDIETTRSFEKITLFKEEDIHNISAKQVRRRMFDVLDQVVPDIIAIPGWSERAAISALDWSTINNKKVILMSDSTEDDTVRVWWKEGIKQRIVKCCSAALVAGKPHIEYIAKLGIPKRRIFTAYDVVDNAYFNYGSGKYREKKESIRKELGLNRPFFLSVSRFVEEKNIFQLLKAYADYVNNTKGSAHDFVLIGDGPLKHDIVQNINDLGLRDKVRLPGFIQYGDLPKYYALADFFILASIQETWGLVVNEAMASELPVLVSKKCGCWEDLIKEGKNGFTFDPYKIDEISSRLELMGSDKVDREAMGQKSKEIIDFFSPEIFSRNLWSAADAITGLPKVHSPITSKPVLWALSNF